MRICCVLTDRANYGRLKPLLLALRAESWVNLSIICGGTTVLSRFGNLRDAIERDGFDVTGEVWHEVEGATHHTMAISCGMGLQGYASEFRRQRPDLLLLIGDRYEALGAACAAHLMNVPILHVQGGEVSGCVDDRTRNAITAMATYHVPATKLAAKRLGVPRDKILTIGCPASDLCARVEYPKQPTGPIMVAYHPDTLHNEDSASMLELLEALKLVDLPYLLWWPNIDAGNEAIHKVIRRFLSNGDDRIKTVRNMPPEEYLASLANTVCAVGNSSSFVRDAGYFGTPVVLVGDRQAGREHGTNVINIPPERGTIAEAILWQLTCGRHAPSILYGDGQVSQRIVKALKDIHEGSRNHSSTRRVEGIPKKEPVFAKWSSTLAMDRFDWSGFYT